MKTKNRILVIALMLICAVVLISRAEKSDTHSAAPAEPGFMMINYHQCWPDKMPEVREFSSKHLEPVLAELEAEGAIQGWGVLEHGWGDEWNWIFYIITESHGSFVEMWEQFGAKLTERQPGFYEDVLATYCFAHKDNMYVVNAMSGN